MQPLHAHSSPAVQARLAEACLELLRIPSVTGQEAELVRHLKRWASAQRQLGKDDVSKYDNALVIGHPDDRRPCVALVGHLDTVPPSPGDLSARQDGDRILGRGASDMKGGIAVMQVLLETLDLDNLPFALMLVLYDREEGPYDENGLQPLLEQNEALQSVDLAIVLEPTDNTLQLGCLGSLHATVTFEGKAAHSARPWQGDNAIHKAGPMLVTLLNRRPRDVEVSGLVFRESMSATLARAGASRNVVPSELELNLNYRFAPTPPLDTAVQRATAELERVASGAKVQVVDVAPPGPVPVDNPIVEHLQAIAALQVEPKLAWTDVARLASFGIDAVNFGPGATAQAHQAGEWVSHQELVRAYDVLASVLTTPLHGA